MSTVLDVKSITIDGVGPVVVGSGQIASVNVTAVNPITDVTIVVDNPLDSAVIQVPGIQGSPGLQNVYISADDPSIPSSEFPDGWGPEQKNFLWVKL